MGGPLSCCRADLRVLVPLISRSGYTGGKEEKPRVHTKGSWVWWETVGRGQQGHIAGSFMEHEWVGQSLWTAESPCLPGPGGYAVHKAP